jgi:hypothetical protein
MDRFTIHLPESLQLTLQSDAYIAGGAIVNLVLDEPINDYDIFFKSQGAALEFRTYFKQLQEFPADRKLQVRAITENGITILITETDEIIQMVTRFFGPTDRVFKSFDFVHCMAYFDLATHDLHYNQEIILRKELVYSDSDQYPVNAMKRLVRFVNRGWQPNNETILNLCDRISKMDLSDEKVRADQLIGFYGSSMK